MKLRLAVFRLLLLSGVYALLTGVGVVVEHPALAGSMSAFISRWAEIAMAAEPLGLYAVISAMWIADALLRPGAPSADDGDDDREQGVRYGANGLPLQGGIDAFGNVDGIPLSNITQDMHRTGGD